MAKMIEVYYRQGLYTDADLDVFVKAGFITSEESENMKEEKSGQDF